LFIGELKVTGENDVMRAFMTWNPQHIQNDEVTREWYAAHKRRKDMHTGF
jgi:hypothetical protein